MLEKWGAGEVLPCNFFRKEVVWRHITPEEV
jgi:hypothetical protein